MSDNCDTCRLWRAMRLYSLALLHCGAYFFHGLLGVWDFGAASKLYPMG